MTELRILETPQALARAAAEEFALQAKRAVAARGSFTVALSGGSTPKGMFLLLANDSDLRAQVPWERIAFFWGDERAVPPEHPDSNFRMANESLIVHVPVQPHNIHRIMAELPDPAQAAVEYEHDLRQVLKLEDDELPRFDLVLLGMGAEGHTASLFPGTHALHETTRLVVANWVGKLYSWRITLTPPVINSALNIIFLVSGEEKALALKGVLEGLYEPEQLPAQMIQPTGGRLVWMLDRAAASRLDPNRMYG